MSTKDACPICGGNKADGLTTFTVDLRFGVVVVRKVSARVCGQCGEHWIEKQVAQSLEKIVDKARKKHAEVEIVHWDKDAAA